MNNKYNLGDRILNTSINEKGIIVEIYPARRGRQLYKVKYNDGRENDENSLDLMPDIQLTDPFKRCQANYYNYYADYLKGNTTFKIKSSNNSTISSLKASRTLFKAYQFKPLLKFLNSDNRRLLIADEVGLGKTIEAGHILLELKARGEFHNALVICPMSLRAKWKTELNEKFGLDFIEIEKKETLLHELDHHNGRVRAVINYDKIREDSDILKCIEEKNIKFSIVICDESHKLRNRDTLIYEGTRQLLESANGAVFMSATPIMIDEANLFNQLHLLDNDTYYKEEIFRNNLHLNQPFVRALSQLNEGRNLSSIRKDLENATVITTNTINDIASSQEYTIKDYFKDYPLYQQIIKNLSDRNNEKQNVRAQIQYDLSVMSPMSNIFTRTRKREVTQDWSQAERSPFKMQVSLYPDERIAYDEAIEKYVDDHQTYDEYGRLVSGSMGLVTFKRQLASSVWGTLNDNDNLDDNYDYYAKEKDAKFDKLLQIIDTVLSKGNKKIIVFAVFKKTLKYLRIRLQKAGYKSALIYGDTHIDKNEVLQQFQKDDSIQVLLSSEVGSEGLDMQFCNSLVNYDLPWNPMVVEQRIGRIDRFGQESKKVNIYNIVVTESILEDIYSRLLSRIGIFRDSIGDLEAILDSEIDQGGKKVSIKEVLKNIERDYYSDKLTPEEVRRKEEEINQAIENEKLNLKQIEEGLTNTLTNDSYFRNEIQKIEGNNAYVTAYELYKFVGQIVKEYLTTCELRSTADSDIYEFVIPKSDKNVLVKFLQKYEPENPESQILFRRYVEDIRDEHILRFTFDQERAFKDKSLTFINLYHPIIQAGVRLFEEIQDQSQCTFLFNLHRTNLPSVIHNGKYMLAIYTVTVSRTLFGDTPLKTESLYPVLFDIADNTTIQNQDIAEHFMGRAQMDGEFTLMDDSFHLDSEFTETLRYTMSDEISDYVNSYRNDMAIRIENNKRMRYEQTRQFYASRIDRLEENLANQEFIVEVSQDEETVKKAARIIPAMRGRLRDFKQERDEALEHINRDANLKVTASIKSLSLINVID